jgi:hypothetical protein
MITARRIGRLMVCSRNECFLIVAFGFLVSQSVFHIVGPSQRREVKRVLLSKRGEERRGDEAGSSVLHWIVRLTCVLLLCTIFRWSDKAVLSSTNLQMLLYYNFFYSMAYAWFFVLSFRYKVRKRRGGSRQVVLRIRTHWTNGSFLPG